MKVAIAGYGIEGEASYRYFVARGDEVTILDERDTLDRAVPAGAKVLLGAGVFDHLEIYDEVIRTPALLPQKLSSARKIWSATNEFFAQCPAPIIGVTGTKGKGTTCSLITGILRASGKTAHLVGNIGLPALDVLSQIHESDFVVYELSSFQLWDLEKSPHVAVVMMIEPDHLDVHKDFAEYLDAKKQIRRFQTADDTCIYHPVNEYAYQIAASIAPQTSDVQDLQPQGAHRYAVSGEHEVYVQDGNFCRQDEVLCSTDALQLPGRHNLDNACAAMSTVATLCPEITSDQFAAGLRDFTGLPHRLKFVREVHGVSYYDDSIATTPGSAIAALRAFDQPKLIILGGSDKGADYQLIVDECKRMQAHVLAIGQTGERIQKLCEQGDVLVTREIGLMQDVVRRASELATDGSVVILSPASASFDQYKNYSDRGDQFITAVNQLPA